MQGRKSGPEPGTVIAARMSLQGDGSCFASAILRLRRRKFVESRTERDGYVNEPVSENPAWRSTKGTPSLETVGFTVLADRGLFWLKISVCINVDIFVLTAVSCRD